MNHSLIARLSGVLVTLSCMLVGSALADTYGDPAIPVAGTVLGTVVHTTDAEELRYYRTDDMHSFYEPGSAEEAAAFGSPPWTAQ